MMNDQQISTSTNRRQLIVGAAAAFGGLALFPASVRASTENGVIRTAESIHQEPMFKGSRKRVYEALTETKRFQKLIDLSGAMKSMALGSKPTEISREVGGTFAIFGGYIVGRHLELVPEQRIVQAWRVGSWDPGVYSIAKFELVEKDGGTKIVFDHTGFPTGLGEHLADGWQSHYWEPLQQYLG